MLYCSIVFRLQCFLYSIFHNMILPTYYARLPYHNKTKTILYAHPTTAQGVLYTHSGQDPCSSEFLPDLSMSESYVGRAASNGRCGIEIWLGHGGCLSQHPWPESRQPDLSSFVETRHTKQIRVEQNASLRLPLLHLQWAAPSRHWKSEYTLPPRNPCR